MQPQNENPYGFIFDQGKQKQPRSLRPRSNTSKILMSIGFIAGVIIIVIIGLNVVLSIGKANNEDLINVRANQVEILRVIELGQKNVSDIDLRNRIASMQATISSDANSLSDLLKKRKVKIESLQLNALKDEDTDEALDTALQNGSGHDEILLKKIEELSNSYYTSLKTAKTDVESKSESDILDKAITNIELSAGN